MSNNRYTVLATVMSHALSLSKEKGTPSVKFVFKSTPVDAEDQPRTLYADLWLTDAAFEASVRTLRETFGWQGADMAELNQPILRDIEVELVCEVEVYENKEREVVRFINLPGGAGVKALDEMAAANLCASLNAKLAGMGQKAVAGRQSPSRQSDTGSGASRPPQHGRQGSYTPGRGRGAAPSGPDDFPGFAPPQEDGEY